jgi:hypothetical protein
MRRFTCPSEKLIRLSMKLDYVTVYHCDNLLEVRITQSSAKSIESGQILRDLSVGRDQLLKGTNVICSQLKGCQF